MTQAPVAPQKKLTAAQKVMSDLYIASCTRKDAQQVAADKNTPKAQKRSPVMIHTSKTFIVNPIDAMRPFQPFVGLKGVTFKYSADDTSRVAQKARARRAKRVSKLERQVK